MTTFSYIQIPCRIDQELEERYVTGGCEDEPEAKATAEWFGRQARVKLTLLVRPSDGSVPGLFAYSSSDESPNVRATRLAMACGHLSLRFRGDVLLFRHFQTSITLSDVYGAACVSPDLRESVHRQIGSTTPIPPWIIRAAQQNYHDFSALNEFALAMSASKSGQAGSDVDGRDSDEDDTGSLGGIDKLDQGAPRQFVSKTPLCLECRRPCKFTCPDCQGCYFCGPPRTCRVTCWSHDCVCATWKVYTERRSILKNFPFGAWHLQLLTRENELSEEPCRRFLEEHLGLAHNESSWWRTETDGWAGGQSVSAKMVDPSIRRSYKDGFAPVSEIPPERRLSVNERAGFPINEIGFIQLSSWKDYFQLRSIPLTSPVAILLTFPLTVYHAIETFGHVPVTVARMLKRPMRLHLVGVEKELNFLDMFQEVGYLLPDDFEVSWSVIVSTMASIMTKSIANPA